MVETQTIFEKLDLRKEKVQKLALLKGIAEKSLQFVVVLDYSGSMSHLYQNGAVQELVEKLLPFGMALDANQTVDVYIFESGATKVKECRMSNITDFVNKNIIGKYSMGGTNYAPIINMIVKDFGGTMHDPGTIAAKKTSWKDLLTQKINKVSNKLGRGNIVDEPATATPNANDGAIKQFEHPVYVAFITDGDCGDEAEAIKAVINASYSGIFFQFIGIGNEQFRFLQKLDTMDGRLVDNANFQKASDIMTTTDDHLYDLLMIEYPGYVPQAKKLGLIA